MKLLRLLSLTTLSFFMTTAAAWAQPDADIGAAVGGVGTNKTPFTNLGNLITTLLQLVYYAAGLFFSLSICFSAGSSGLLPAGTKLV